MALLTPLHAAARPDIAGTLPRASVTSTAVLSPALLPVPTLPAPARILGITSTSLLQDVRSIVRMCLSQLELPPQDQHLDACAWPVMDGTPPVWPVNSTAR